MPAKEPFTLVVTSHKGGTGRTTLTLALAWSLGQRGVRVGLQSAAGAWLASDAEGHCRWPGVTRATTEAVDVCLIDGPRLGTPQADAVLAQAQAVVLTCLPELLGLRTLPVAIAALSRAGAAPRGPRFLGVLLNRLRPGHVLHGSLFQWMAEVDRELVLEPLIPDDAELTRWAERPGSEPPAGPGREAIATLAERLPLPVPAR